MKALTILAIFIASEIHNQELNLNELVYIQKINIFSLMCTQLCANIKTNAVVIKLLPIFVNILTYFSVRVFFS